jgi:hypothetical protein
VCIRSLEYKGVVDVHRYQCSVDIVSTQCQYSVSAVSVQCQCGVSAVSVQCQYRSGCAGYARGSSLSPPPLLLERRVRQMA